MKRSQLNNAKPLIFLLAILMALSTFSGVLKMPSTLYFVLVSIFLLFCVVIRLPEMRIGQKDIILFLLICVISIIINKPASYFRVWERFAIFLATVVSFSPLVVGNKINISRGHLFESLLIIMVLYSTISFVCYFFGINFFVRDGYTLDYQEVGHFSGITIHSMMLAPISSLACLFAFIYFLRYFAQKNKRLIWGGVSFVCFGSILMSASRGALGATLVSLVIMLLRYNVGRIGSTLKYLILIFLIGLITFPIWGGLTSNVISKQEANESQGGTLFSREVKMAARIYEIQNNFFSGVGFATVDESVDDVDRSTGTIEPNSSWLGVFSMTGIFGFITFLLFNIRIFLVAYLKIPDKYMSTLMSGILVFFFIHMLIEGYVLASGNILCGMYWLSTGVVYACKKERSFVKAS